MVDPGVDIGPGTVVVVTPYVNLRDRVFWVFRNEDVDTFNIRMSSPRGSETQFGWIIVEVDAPAEDPGVETGQATG